MDVQLVKIKREERQVLENLFFYYVYDMSEYMKWNPDKNGTFGGMMLQNLTLIGNEMTISHIS